MSFAQAKQAVVEFIALDLSFYYTFFLVWNHWCFEGAKSGAGTGLTLSGDVISHTGVVFWNVIAHIADIWLIIWALWGEQVQSRVSQCSSVWHKLSLSLASSVCLSLSSSLTQEHTAVCQWLPNCSSPLLSVPLQNWKQDTAACLYFLWQIQWDH